MLNKIIIMGRLTAEPELTQTQIGVSVCRFTVAVDRNYSGQGQEKQTDFISAVAWRQTAEFVSRYFGKGKMICVEGSLETRSYSDRKYPDVKHYVSEVKADSVYFCGDKAAAQTAPAAPAPAPAQNMPAAPSAPVEQLNLSGEFEEITGGELPF